MRVGHGAAPLEVIIGEPMGGYAAREGGLSGVLDPLEVHAISFTTDGIRFLLVVVDVVCVNVDLVDEIRARCADHATTVWVAATHTHSAPESGCRPRGGQTPAGVARRIVAAAVSAARDARDNEQDARLQVVRTRCADVASRRTGPSPDAIDLPVDAVLVRGGADDVVRGALVVTPVHPTVLPADNGRASADLSGAVRRAAEHRWGGWAVAATGAAGDVSTRGARRHRDAAELARLAALLIDALPEPAAGQEGAGSIRHGSARGELAANTTTAMTLAAPLGDPGEDPRWREVYEQGRRALVDLGGHHRATPVSVVVEAVEVGTVRFVGIPGEPFLDIGERIHRETGAVVLGCTNGYVGYLPVAGTPTTYETIISPVDAGEGDHVVRLGVAAVATLSREEKRRP